WRIRKQQAEWEYYATLAELKVRVSDSTNWMPLIVPASYAGNSALLEAYDILSNNSIRKSQGILQMQQADWSLQKKGLYPELSMNYANMTIVGWQKVDNYDRYFGSDSRFGMVGLGLKMPLWYRPQVAGVNAAKYQYLAARYAHDYEVYSIKNQLQIAAQEVKKRQYQLDGYKQYAVASSDSTVLLAKLQLQTGNISYVEWMLFMNSVHQTMENYYQALQRCNEAWFRFESLINQ
ncbi:MAG: hypothetical protein EBV15_11080, partial [Bacteroidetes bacterium]|nr:hypothetical protein [Bacteroidota bacterium]